MTPTISVTGLTRRYRDQLALDDVTVDIEGPTITGLLRRNGAGKSTLMRIIANQEFASSGKVEVVGASPVENDMSLRRMILVREDQIFRTSGCARRCRRHRCSTPTGAVTWPRRSSPTSTSPRDGRSRSSPAACARPSASSSAWRHRPSHTPSTPARSCCRPISSTRSPICILALTPAGHSAIRSVGGLGSTFILAFVLGAQTVARSLPFGLALGLSRRSYYLGTTLLAIAFAAIVGVVTAVGQAIERATGGWGIGMGFFRVPYILDGPWYLTG